MEHGTLVMVCSTDGTAYRCECCEAEVLEAHLEVSSEDWPEKPLFAMALCEDCAASLVIHDNWESDVIFPLNMSLTDQLMSWRREHYATGALAA